MPSSRRRCPPCRSYFTKTTPPVSTRCATSRSTAFWPTRCCWPRSPRRAARRRISPSSPTTSCRAPPASPSRRTSRASRNSWIRSCSISRNPARPKKSSTPGSPPPSGRSASSRIRPPAIICHCRLVPAISLRIGAAVRPLRRLPGHKGVYARLRGLCPAMTTKSASIRLDTRDLDHFGPFLGFRDDELAEVGGRAGQHRGAELGEPRLHLGIGEGRIGLLVEPLDHL